MGLNPMAFVTQPRQSRATSGLELASALAENKNAQARQKLSAGYLALQTRQTDFSEEKYRQAELDKALAQLDDARLMGNADMVSAAEDQVRKLAQRNGYGISAAAAAGAPGGLATAESESIAAKPEAEVGTEENPLDLDDPESGKKFDRQRGAPTEDESNASIDQKLQLQGGTSQSPEALEAQLVAGSGKQPERMEQGGQTTPAMREFLARSLGLSGPPANLRDFTGPAETRSAAPQVGAMRFGPGVPPPRHLSALTITDQKGNVIYQASGEGSAIADRQRLRAKSVFAELSKQAGDDVERGIIGQAGDAAAALIGTMPLEKAVAHGLELYHDAMARKNALSVVEANRKPKFGAGGGGGYTGKTDDTINDDLDKVRQQFANTDAYKSIQEKKEKIEGAQIQLQSENGMSQQEAVSTLRRIQSGLTLNAFETSEFNNAAGAIEGIYNKFQKLFGGGELSPEYKRQLVEVYRRLRQTLDQHEERLAQKAYDYWMESRKRRASPEIIKEKGDALKKSLRSDGGSDAPTKGKALLED